MSSPAASMASQAARDRVGRVLRDKWHLDEVIGTGGFSAVYAATHRNGKRVAIKILHPELSAIDTARSRFLREAYAVNAVEHSGMVSVVDDDVDDDGCVFLVMDLLEGETLEERRQRSGGSLDFDDVLMMGDDVLDVLAAAHEKGVIHRDLKPENVFICKNGQIKLLDFGVAKLREMPHAKALTVNGIVIGTPAFMPPEQARGQWEQVDERSDVWSMGATMFTLLTGQLVHGHLSPQEALVASVSRPAPSLDEISPGAPRSLVAFMARALAFDRANRFQSAREMQRAVRALLGELSSRPSVRRAHIDNETTLQDDRKSVTDDSSSVTRPRSQFLPADAVADAANDLRPSAPPVRELQSLFDAQASATDLKNIVRDKPPAPLQEGQEQKETSKDDDKTLVRPSKSAPPPRDSDANAAALKEKRVRAKAKPPPPPQNKVPLWGWAVLILLTIFIILMALLLVKEMKRPHGELHTPGQTFSLVSS
jgi:serine/threonine protein kinase